MKIKIVIKYLAVLVLAISIFTACSSKIKEVQGDAEIPKYEQVTVLENKDNKCDVYKAEPRGLYKIGNSPNNVLEMAYTKGKSTVELVNISQGKNLPKNTIKIYRNDKMMTLDTFYSAEDLTLNASGTKLAFRSYKDDSLESAEGLKVFDINSREIINLKSKVLVSGNIYCWLDETNILYYGSTGEQQDSGKIYKYNFENETEEVYLDNIEGYCTFILPVNQGLVYLKEGTEGTKLIHFNKSSGSSTVLTDDISRIHNAKFNSKTSEVFFTGNKIGLETPELYKISIKSKETVRITYDFPSSLEADSNLCIDKAGNVYFKAMQGVYMYNIVDNSVNLISTHTGKYSVYQDVNS